MLSRLSLSRTVYARRTVGAGPEGVCFRLYVESKLHTITYLATTANVTTSVEVVITFPTSLLFPAEIFCSGENRRWEFSLRYFALAIADESSVTSNFIDFFRWTVSKLFFLLLWKLMSQSKETGNKMKCYRRLIRIQYSQDPIKTCRYRLCHEV